MKILVLREELRVAVTCCVVVPSSVCSPMGLGSTIPFCRGMGHVFGILRRWMTPSLSKCLSDKQGGSARGRLDVHLRCTSRKFRAATFLARRTGPFLESRAAWGVCSCETGSNRPRRTIASSPVLVPGEGAGDHAKADRPGRLGQAARGVGYQQGQGVPSPKYFPDLPHAGGPGRSDRRGGICAEASPAGPCPSRPEGGCQRPAYR